MATIADVARAAGVSPMTVSNVINERPGVRPATREKVLTAITELQYRVNVAARNLRQGRTGTIGVAVPEIDRPYYTQLSALLIEHARQFGYRVVIEQTGANREAEINALKLSRNRMYDGLILATVGMGVEDVDALRVDFPVVILGERIFGGPVDHIGMPNVEGAAAATSVLLEAGCRRVAMVGADVDDTGTDVTSLRAAGYRQALAEAGRSSEECLIGLSRFTMAGAADSVRKYFRHGTDVDGIFCVTDTIAFGAMRGLADLGLRIPEDVKVVGFDDVQEASFSIPSLTSISPDHEWTARTAVDLLHERMTGEREKPSVELVSPYSLTRRESSAVAVDL